MSKVTLLTVQEVSEDSKIELFEEYGTDAKITDFGALLGGYKAGYDGVVNTVNPNYDNGNYVVLTNRNKVSVGERVVTVNYEGWLDVEPIYSRDIGIRPVVPYSIIAIDSKENEEHENMVYYGQYPQTVASGELNDVLEKLYTQGLLNETGRVYTTDSRETNKYKADFKQRQFIEYSHEGEKYVRCICINDLDKVIGRSVFAEKNKPIWVKVEPISWFVDKKRNMAITEKLLVSGIQFHNGKKFEGAFEDSNLGKFLNEIFIKEIVPDKYYFEEKESSLSKNAKNMSHDFNFDEVSEEDIIKSAIESNIAVFLHGRSSEGKSARVKQLDPDLEIIYLRNATPDSLNGKSVYNASTGDMIDVPPTWYKKIVAKCEAEPNKLHILFFDEITNALPSIQGMAFNIILDKEVNGIWKLPSNCRIVAAGNDLNDSLAANTMAEPLFNRFAHVYIETKVNDWLKWAITEDSEYERLDNVEVKEKRMKIHPAIYAYVAYKGENVLRTKFDGIKPNADPRKWELASKMLYTSKRPETLRSLIGYPLTQDFCSFLKNKVITIEDVVNGNYEESDFYVSTAKKYLTILGLSKCEEKDIAIVRKFVSKLGKEVLAAFDGLWSQGNENRLEKLAELSESDETREEKVEINENNSNNRILSKSREEIEAEKAARKKNGEIAVNARIEKKRGK